MKWLCPDCTNGPRLDLPLLEHEEAWFPASLFHNPVHAAVQLHQIRFSDIDRIRRFHDFAEMQLSRWPSPIPMPLSLLAASFSRCHSMCLSRHEILLQSRKHVPAVQAAASLGMVGGRTMVRKLWTQLARDRTDWRCAMPPLRSTFVASSCASRNSGSTPSCCSDSCFRCAT